MTEQETVECKTCEHTINIEDAEELSEKLFVCDPDLQPYCLWQFNNENFVRSEFYD